MPDILTITLNPAVDLATSVPAVVAGPKLYCDNPRVDPGGGGVNVARAIRKLGGDATALLAVAGAMGHQLLHLLDTEGVPTCPVWMHGETRQSLAVTDATTGEQYRFSLPGEVLTEDEAGDLLSAISKAAGKECLVVLSGGVAPGLPDDFPTRVQEALASKTDRLIVDTSRAPLSRLIDHPAEPLLMLRVDQKEAAAAANRPMTTIDDSLTFASALVDRGVARMVVTGRGAEGSVMVTQTARFHCQAPMVEVRSKIGAGDAFVGAMTLALARGDTPDQALRWGVAAASATVGTEGTKLFERSVTESIFQDCVLTEV